MKYILPKPDIRYFDEGLNSQIESHSHAQLRIEVAKARADEREACAKMCDDVDAEYEAVCQETSILCSQLIRARSTK